MKQKAFLSLFIILIMINKIIMAGEAPKEKIADSTYSSDVLSIGENRAQLEDRITWHQMLTNVPSDYASFFHNSLKIKEITAYLKICTLTGAFMLIDQQGWRYNNLLYRKSHVIHNISDFIVNAGDGRYQLLAAALFAVPGIAFHDKTALKTGSNIAEAVIATGLCVQMLKRISGRQSPSASTENGGDWDPFPSFKQYQKNQPAFYSFPSGHLSTATAVVTVIANNYPDIKWIKPVGYSLLGMLSFSLVNKGMHWYSDFPLAFFLGYTFGNIIAPVKNISDQTTNSPDSHLIVTPSYINKNIALSAIYNF